MGIATNSRVLVTGGTGLVGAYIIAELVRLGFPVRAIRRTKKLPFFIPSPLLEKVEWVQGDILDLVSLQDAMEGMDAVIHAAATISFAPGDRKKMYMTNIRGTSNMVNLALERNVARFVHLSSVSALGRSDKGETISEGNQWEPFRAQTHYAASKYHGEMEVWRGIAEGLPAVIINPSTVLGYGDWNTGSCAIFKSVYDEFPWYTRGINGFVDVEDLARSVAMFLQSDTSGERFLISAENWSFRKLFNAIADGFSKRHPLREAGPFLGAIAWRMEKIKSWVSGKPSILTRETARMAQSSSYFDHSKILRHLPGFQFTPLEESIQRICLSYLRQGQPQ